MVQFDTIMIFEIVYNLYGSIIDYKYQKKSDLNENILI